MGQDFEAVCKDAVQKIRDAVEQGLSFDEACTLIEVEDAGLRECVINDSLKAIIIDLHFSRGLPLKTVAMRLRVSLSRLLNAKKGMPDQRSFASEAS